MITQKDIKLSEELEEILYKMCEDNDKKFHIYAALIAKMRSNLIISTKSYKEATMDDIDNGFYTVKCECGWWGSSKLLNGGDPIADTGDYTDCTCPVCDTTDPNEKTINFSPKTTSEFNRKYQKYIKDRFYGMTINNIDVIKYLDEEFSKEIMNNSDFKFTQIKLKFGMPRVYTTSEKNNEWEKQIDKLLNIT